jgi:LPS-assembly protein
MIASPNAKETQGMFLLFFLNIIVREFRLRPKAAILLLFTLFLTQTESLSQQTNSVDRLVTNPITDTPNVNPLTQEQTIPSRLPVQNGAATGQSSEELEVRAESQDVQGPKDGRVITYEGNVDARIGIYRLQADKITIYESTNKVIAEGNVVFDHGESRITGSRAEWNYQTKLGHFENSTGFTNQTQDGTVIYFTADRAEKISADTVVATNAEITSCEDNVPKWSFRTSRVEIKMNSHVAASRPSFRVKGIPIAYLPYVSVPIKKRDRASGFLTPTFSGSGTKGFRLSNAYYLTLGRSADITLRNDIYSARGLGFGADIRTRANSRSFMNLGIFAVRDRMFGREAGPDNPDQGGSSFYMDGVHYFPNGYLAAADVNITSNLAFRQVFSDSIQQAISPEERSQLFINKNFDEYSFNILARAQVTSIPNVRIRTRQLPSISFEKRPSILGFLKSIPFYTSFEGAMEGVSRKETVDDMGAFLSTGLASPLISPSLVQRLDIFPRVSMPLYFSGWSLTANAGFRTTYYSNSLTPETRTVSRADLVRGYGDLEVDLRPPALAKNYRRRGSELRFRHVIEPYITYRKIQGIKNFHRTIIFDYVDAIADTNEVEYGITNRFFTRRKSVDAEGDKGVESQPYEALSLTVRNKYFFDPYFGDALIPGLRNQFQPITSFSGFSYGGVPRHFSPVVIEGRYRPKYDLYTDVRTDLDVQGGGLRNLSVSFGMNRPLIQAFQTFYYTRSITLAESLRRYSDLRGKEPATLQGSQWSPSLFLGNRSQGLFGGVSFFFDFQNRPGKGSSSLISSTSTIGYAFDCCAITLQNYSFNVGLRNENRLLFSFRLNGIGAFGTEQVGQRFR